MNRKTRQKFTYYAFSLVLAVLLFTAGSRVLYADLKRTTSVTTTRIIPIEPQATTVRVEQPARVTTVDRPAVTVEQPASQNFGPGAATEVKVQQRQPAAQVTVDTSEEPVPAAAVVTTTSAPAVRKTVISNAIIDYDIDVKKIFASNENVQGDIIVKNPSSVVASDAVHTRLYHNGKLIKEILTRLNNIPPGETRFPFDRFGIPQINNTAEAQGDWTMSIFSNDPAYSKNADFRIIHGTNSNNLQR